MLIFAIAFVPEGNMIRRLRELRSFAFRSGDNPEASALPEGIYWGFYSSDGSKANESALARSFRRSSEDLFRGLPDLLTFESSAFRDGKWYIAPRLPFSEGITAAADKIAAGGGFLPSGYRPFVPGAGFFAGIDVTPPPFEAFSFRHLDALLLKIDSDDLSYTKAWWTVIARTSRRTGPRQGRPRRDRQDQERRRGKDAAESTKGAP
jgi:hypothetical protein